MDYYFFTRPNFSTNYMNIIKYQKKVPSNDCRYGANIIRNLGGYKIF